MNGEVTAYRISCEPEASPDDLQVLEEAIIRFNLVTTGIHENGGVTYFLRSPEGEVAGGIHGWTWGGCLQIHYLWVREELRGRGYGTELRRRAEAAARDRGCRQALLETHSFQAPELYRRLGYEVFGVVEGYPPGSAKYYLRKSWAKGGIALHAAGGSLRMRERNGHQLSARPKGTRQ